VFSIRFEFKDNIDFIHTFRWVDKNGDPISLVGSTLRLHVKRNAKDAKPILEMTSENGLATIGGTDSNLLSLKFPRYSLPPGHYVFDWKYIQSGDHLPLAEGELIIGKGVTT
jgi:hypothetical protein